MPSNKQFDKLLHNTRISNLVELYEPMRLLSRALHDPHAVLDTSTSKREGNPSSFRPDFDLRETSAGYFLEGEFAGVPNRDAIRLKWLNSNTLHVEATIPSVNLEQEWGDMTREQNAAMLEAAYAAAQEAKSDEQSVPVERARGDEKSEKHGEHRETMRTWLNERRMGSCSRTFNFPNAVDMDGVRAKLNQGLLKIFVPKLDQSRLRTRDIAIQEEN